MSPSLWGESESESILIHQADDDDDGDEEGDASLPALRISESPQLPADPQLPTILVTLFVSEIVATAQ